MLRLQCTKKVTQLILKNILKLFQFRKKYELVKQKYLKNVKTTARIDLELLKQVHLLMLHSLPLLVPA